MTASTATETLTPPASGAIEYPSSDGEPMAETDLHRRLLTQATDLLILHFASNPGVYVSGNLMVYYQEGKPQACLSPDCFVAFGVGPGDRKTFKTWAEGVLPAVVFEFTSHSTRDNDLVKKFAIYQDVWEVSEYFLFDPYEEYLNPPLQGFQRDRRGILRPIVPDADGSVFSERLNLKISRDGRTLAYNDAETGERLLDAGGRQARHEAKARAEAEQVARAAQQSARAAEQRANNEATARREAEAQLAEALAELARLRKSP